MAQNLWNWGNNYPFTSYLGSGNWTWLENPRTFHGGCCPSQQLTGIWPSCLNVVYGWKPPFDIPSVPYGHHSTFRIMKNTKPPWKFTDIFLDPHISCLHLSHVGVMACVMATIPGHDASVPRLGAQVFPSSPWPGLWTAGSWMGSARPPEAAPKPTATTATRRGGIDRWSRKAGGVVWGKNGAIFLGKAMGVHRKWETNMFDQGKNRSYNLTK